MAVNKSIITIDSGSVLHMEKFSTKSLMKLDVTALEDVGFDNDKTNGLMIVYPKNENLLGRHMFLGKQAKAVLKYNYHNLTSDSNSPIKVTGDVVKNSVLYEFIGVVPVHFTGSIKEMFKASKNIKFSSNIESRHSL